MRKNITILLLILLIAMAASIKADQQFIGDIKALSFELVGAFVGTIDISGNTNLGTANAGGVCTVVGDNIDCQPTYDREPCAFTNPVTGHSGTCGWHFSQAATITRVWCFTRGSSATATIQIDEAAEAGIESSGTDVMASQLICDEDGQATTSFSNAGIAANSLLNLDIDAIANAPTNLQVYIEYAYQ